MAGVSTKADQPHLPVLYKEIIHALQPKSAGRYVDCTVGAGGHSAGILEVSSPDGLLLGLDLDPQALAIARERLAHFGQRARLVQESYVRLTQVLRQLDWNDVDGIVFDLGVSSMQLDTAERGFSFLQDAPLDMRFGPEVKNTAGELVNTLSEAELADLIFRYGEDRHSRKIARAIVQARPLRTTGSSRMYLAREKHERIHPATAPSRRSDRRQRGARVARERPLPAVAALKPATSGSISFQSLEDRIVKHFMRIESRDCICPPEQPVCTCGHKATLREISRKPITPTGEEMQVNSRARSAKLRIAERIRSL
jgi:16S rRNA (cytosine1402-N4)-methyltransferase